MLSASHILLTGATGLIGGELLPLLLRHQPSMLWALIRPRNGADSEARLAERLQRSGYATVIDAPELLGAIAGDMTEGNLGLTHTDLDQITRSVNLIIHCAAETSFIRDEGCHRINIEGMRRLIEFARRCRRDPLIVHVSTATVCGAVIDRCVSEDDRHDADGQHYNEYTRTKSLAESMLRSSGLRHLILRPSIVVSAGLPDPVFARAIMWFLPLLNELDAVPINADARLDVAPVAFVAESIVDLLLAPRLDHDCYHISAGVQDATPLGESGRFVDRYYGRQQPLRLIPPAEWTRDVHRQYVHTPEQRKVFSALRHYLPFLNMNVAYDNSRLRRALAPRPLVIEPFSSYATGLLELMTPQLSTKC